MCGWDRDLRYIRCVYSSIYRLTSRYKTPGKGLGQHAGIKEQEQKESCLTLLHYNGVIDTFCRTENYHKYFSSSFHEFVGSGLFHGRDFVAVGFFGQVTQGTTARIGWQVCRK